MKILVKRNIEDFRNSLFLDKTTTCRRCGSIVKFEPSDLPDLKAEYSCGLGECLFWNCANCQSPQMTKVSDLGAFDSSALKLIAQDMVNALKSIL